VGERKWDYQEIEGGVKPEMLFPLMRRAAAIYKDQSYQALMAKVPEPGATDRSRLLRPDVTRKQAHP
jgi:hypothetical protein